MMGKYFEGRLVATCGAGDEDLLKAPRFPESPDIVLFSSPASLYSRLGWMDFQRFESDQLVRASDVL